MYFCPNSPLGTPPIQAKALPLAGGTPAATSSGSSAENNTLRASQISSQPPAPSSKPPLTSICCPHTAGPRAAGPASGETVPRGAPGVAAAGPVPAALLAPGAPGPGAEGSLAVGGKPAEPPEPGRAPFPPEGLPTETPPPERSPAAPSGALVEPAAPICATGSSGSRLSSRSSSSPTIWAQPTRPSRRARGIRRWSIQSMLPDRHEPGRPWQGRGVAPAAVTSATGLQRAGKNTCGGPLEPGSPEGSDQAPGGVDGFVDLLVGDDERGRETQHAIAGADDQITHLESPGDRVAREHAGPEHEALQ